MQPANAIVFTFDIEPVGTQYGSFGSGSFDTIDPLSPNQFFPNEPPENVFNDITFTLNNLSATLTTTTFTIDDISEIIFSTDASSNITDFNIGTTSGADNGDFTANGTAPFIFVLNDADTGGFVNGYQFTNIQPIPFEAETSVALLALGGFFGLRKLRQRQAKAKA